MKNEEFAAAGIKMKNKETMSLRPSCSFVRADFPRVDSPSFVRADLQSARIYTL